MTRVTLQTQLSPAVMKGRVFCVRLGSEVGRGLPAVRGAGGRPVALAASVAVGLLMSGAANAGCTTSKIPFLNPFSKNSAHHRPLGDNAVYADDSDPSTVSWFKNTGKRININVGAPWGVSVASTVATDPMVTVGAISRKCDNIQGVPVTIRMPADGFVTSVKLNSNGCTDGVVVLYDKTKALPHQLRQYNWNGGAPLAGQYKTWSISGLGHGTRAGERVGTSASGVAALFGLLRGNEINRSNKKVEHALQMILPARPSNCAMMMSRQVVLPATSGDGYMNDPGNNLGNIPYGALMALPPLAKGGPDLESLGLTDRGKRLAEAVRDYGIYAVDTGDCPALRADQYVQNTAELKAALSTIYPYIRRVLNNDVLGTSTAGGGAGIAPNCANDA